jgi:hypothetical protein
MSNLSLTRHEAAGVQEGCRYRVDLSKIFIGQCFLAQNGSGLRGSEKSSGKNDDAQPAAPLFGLNKDSR